MIPTLRSKRGREGLRELMEAVAPVGTLLEVGSFSGESTEVLSRFAESIIAVDPWVAGYDEDDGASSADMAEVWAAFQARHFHCPVLPVRAASPAIAAWFPCVDMVYIDGCHTEEAVRADIEAWAPRCRILAGHDYTCKPGVRAAVDAMVNHVRLFRDSSWLRVDDDRA